MLVFINILYLSTWQNQKHILPHQLIWTNFMTTNIRATPLRWCFSLFIKIDISVSVTSTYTYYVEISKQINSYVTVLASLRTQLNSGIPYILTFSLTHTISLPLKVRSVDILEALIEFLNLNPFFFIYLKLKFVNLDLAVSFFIVEDPRYGLIN